MSNINERPAVEITNGRGKKYRIWANGKTEGFEDMDPCMVINRIPVIIAQSIEEDREDRAER